MSGTFPATPAPRSIRFGSIQPTRISTSHSLKRYTRTLNAQRWAMTLDFSQLERDDLAPIWAFLVGQRGQYDTFQFVLPNPLYTPRGAGAIGSPSPSVNGNFGSPIATQTGRSIYTKQWQPSTTILKAGDFLKFASHSKVYMAREDVASGSTGLALIPMEPAAVQELSDGDAIITSSVQFTVSLSQDGAGFGVQPGSILDLDTVELVEAL